MPFKPGREPSAPDYKRLLSTLNDSKVREKDTPLYEVIKRLIDWGHQQNTSFSTQIASINQSISEIPAPGGGGGGNGDGGNGEPVEPIIDHDHIPMVTGAEPLELMSDGAGQLLLIEFDE